MLAADPNPEILPLFPNKLLDYFQNFMTGSRTPTYQVLLKEEGSHFGYELREEHLQYHLHTEAKVICKGRTIAANACSLFQFGILRPSDD